MQKGVGYDKALLHRLGPLPDRIPPDKKRAIQTQPRGRGTEGGQVWTEAEI